MLFVVNACWPALSNTFTRTVYVPATLYTCDALEVACGPITVPLPKSNV